MNPLTSIIMPVYNVEKYVGVALESVRIQRNVPLKDLEVVVVDDGSTDKTFQVVGQYMENHPELPIRTFSNDGNKGAAATRNTAMETARGDFFVLLDGDDVLHRDCVSKCVLAYEDSSVGFVYSDHACIGPSIGLDIGEEDLFKVKRKPDFDMEGAINGNYVGHVKSVRASESIPFDVSFRTAEDTEWWMRLALNGVNFHHISEILYYWRRNIESETHGRTSQRETNENHLRALEKIRSALGGKNEAFSNSK